MYNEYTVNIIRSLHQSVVVMRVMSIIGKPSYSDYVIHDMSTTRWAGQPSYRGSIPGEGKRFVLFHNVQTGCRPHPASHIKGTLKCFLVQAERACS
jgi:hypothetical protein